MSSEPLTAEEIAQLQEECLRAFWEKTVGLANDAIRQNPFGGRITLPWDKGFAKNASTPEFEAAQAYFKERGWKLEGGWSGNRDEGHLMMVLTPPS